MGKRHCDASMSGCGIVCGEDEQEAGPSKLGPYTGTLVASRMYFANTSPTTTVKKST